MNTFDLEVFEVIMGSFGARAIVNKYDFRYIFATYDSFSGKCLVGSLRLQSTQKLFLGI